MIAASIFLFPDSSFAILSNEQRVAAEAWNVVDQLYVDRTFNDNDWMKIRQSLIKREYESRDQVYESISEEMLGKLGDRYTRFIVPAKYEALRNAVVGLKNEDVSGIGVTLSVDKATNKVKIVDTIEGSPAAELGLKRDSIIVEVNKIRTDTPPTSLDEVAALLRGPIDSKVVSQHCLLPVNV